MSTATSTLALPGPADIAPTQSLATMPSETRVVRIGHAVVSTAAGAGAVFAEGAREAIRFQGNILLFRLAGRMVLRMAKLAVLLVMLRILRNVISQAHQGKVLRSPVFYQSD